MNIFRLLRTSFQWRLIAFVTPLVLVPLLIVSAILLNQWRTAVVENLNLLEEEHISREAEEISVFMTGAEADIRFMAGLPSVQNLALAVVNGDEEAIEITTHQVEADFLNLAQNSGFYFQVRFIARSGLEVVRVDYDGTEATISSSLQDKSDRGYFTNAIGLPEGQIYISPLDLNREGSPPTILGTITDGTIVPVVRYAIPVYALSSSVSGTTNELGGIIVTSIQAETLFSEFEPSAPDATFIMTDQDGYYLYHSQDATRTFSFEPEIGEIGGIQGANIRQEFTTSEIDFLFASDSDRDQVNDFLTEGGVLVHPLRIIPPGAPAGYFWLIVSQRNEATVLTPINEAINRTIVALGGLLVAITAITFIFSRQLVQPIRKLERTANRFAGGDLEVRAEDMLQRDDEIGSLNRVLNAMATQLSELIGSFEDRLRDRTRDLETVVAVGNQITTILNANRLLQDVVDLTKERFGLYHAHIYILDENSEILVLTAGAGHVGRQMVGEQRTIELHNLQSIVARAARSRTTVIVNDVRASETFLPHPLLPDTHSELAVSLVARGRVLGVLDVQSAQAGYFTDETESVLNILAGQIATALSNAQLFETADRISRHELAMGRIQSQMQTALDMDEVLQVAVRELGKALRVPHTAIEMQLGGNGGAQSIDEVETVESD